MLYGRREAFARLKTYRVRPQSPEPPEKIETGTLNHEGLAGVTAAVDFIAWLGEQVHGEALPGRRQAVLRAMAAIEEYEGMLARRLLAALDDLPGVTVYGPPAGEKHTPTASHPPEAWYG